ncbi:Ctr copper transporter [Dipodascopsis uninucleata]
MVFTWDTTDMCIVFEWWHVRTNLQLILSLITVFLIAMGYEYFRMIVSTMELYSDKKAPASPARSRSRDKKIYVSEVRSSMRSFQKSIFYSLQVIYSFFIMFISMTYNGWVIIAIGLGACIGHWIWSFRVSGAKGMSCH